jgi:carboxypeptidase D
MLYIDQPVGVGFSYTTLVNGTVDFITEQFMPLADPNYTPETNLTTVAATLNTPDLSRVVNTTATAAKMMYRFAQVWFQESVQSSRPCHDIS